MTLMSHEPDHHAATTTKAFDLSNDRPTSAAHWWINLFVSLAVLAGCVYGYTLLGERKRPERVLPPQSDVTQVMAEPLRPHVGPVRIESNGVVVPVREIRLATEIAGRVIELSENLRAGQMVDAGEVLVRLDKIEFELEVSRLQAQAAQETAEVTSLDVSIANTQKLIELAQQQASIAQAELERSESLFDRQAISASEVDVLKRSALAAKTSLVEQTNRRRELVAQRELTIEKKALTAVLLKRAELDLARCEVAAPIRGRVVSSMVEEQSFVSVGTPFVTIEDTSSAEIRTNLTANQMVWVAANQENSNLLSSEVNKTQFPPVAATISYQFGNETYRWPATLMRIDGAGIDLQTRTYPCLFRVNNPETIGTNGKTKRLTRGMFVAISIEAQPDQQLFTVPESAIRPGNRVWLDFENRLRIVPVNIVSRSNEDIVIELKLSPQRLESVKMASVIVSPISDPIEGLAVSNIPLAITQQANQEKNAKPKTLTAIEGNAKASNAETSTIKSGDVDQVKLPNTNQSSRGGNTTTGAGQ